MELESYRHDDQEIVVAECSVAVSLELEANASIRSCLRLFDHSLLVVRLEQANRHRLKDYTKFLKVTIFRLVGQQISRVTDLKSANAGRDDEVQAAEKQVESHGFAAKDLFADRMRFDLRILFFHGLGHGFNQFLTRHAEWMNVNGPERARRRLDYNRTRYRVHAVFDEFPVFRVKEVQSGAIVSCGTHWMAVLKMACFGLSGAASFHNLTCVLRSGEARSGAVSSSTSASTIRLVRFAWRKMGGFGTVRRKFPRTILLPFRMITHDSTGWTTRQCRRFGTTLLLMSVMGVFPGCSSLPFRCPSGEKVIAAREQGRLGLDALARGRLDEAEMRLEAALEECPHDDQLRRDFAQVLWQQNRRNEAKAQMAVALEDSMNSPAGRDGGAAWLVEYGRMMFSDGDLASALQSVDRAIALDPHSGTAWKLKGDVMRMTGQLNEAIANYHRALTSGADQHATLLDLADAYRLQSRPRRALSTLQRLDDMTASNEEPPRLAGMKGAALQALGRHDDAIEYFAKAVNRNARDPELLYMMAVSQSNAGYTESAYSTAARAANLLPTDRRIRTLLASLDHQRAAPSPPVAVPGASQPEIMLTSNEVPVGQQ